MPDAVSNLHIVSQDANGNVVLGWTQPSTIQSADLQFLDIATENGFVAYVLQQPMNKVDTSFAVNLTPGSYWARVNTHYSGFGSGILDRGWFPSGHIPVNVEPVPALPTGTPATNIKWNPTAQYNLTWTPGSGSRPITRVACDISSFPNFGDILASPYVPTDLGGGVVVSGLPFAVDVPLVYNNPGHIGLHQMPIGQDFYVRVNTLYDNRLWVPSTILHFKTDGSVSGMGGIDPWVVAVAVVGAGLVLFFGTRGNGNGEA